MSTYISISEMAKLHGITRQTLIHYDNIDLFKPAKVDTNGYRYYCKHQIPYLREICFLKSLGISLKDIQQHFQERTPENEMYLLEKQKQYIMNQIAKLNTLREYLNQRIDLYEEAVDAGMMRMSLPFVRYIDARQAILVLSSKSLVWKKISGFREPGPVYFCRYGTRSTKIHLRSRPENMCACISMVCLMILSIWKS